MPQLAESIRTLMQDGGDPITLEEVVSRPVSTAIAGRTRPASSLRWPAFAWAGLLCLVIVAVVVLGVTVSAGTKGSGPEPAQHAHGAEPLVVVPNVIGETPTEASKTLQNTGFKVAFGLGKPKPSDGSLQVVEQGPEAGSLAVRGSVVHLVDLPGSSPTPPVVTTEPLSTIPTGVYLQGRQGTPRYFITLDAKGGYQFSGSLNFLYQDGQTAVVFNFNGSAFGGSGQITPTQKGDGSSLLTSTLPSSIGLNYVRDITGFIELSGCNAFLEYVDGSGPCDFAPTTTGLGSSSPALPNGTYSSSSPYDVILNGHGANLLGTVTYTDAGRTSVVGTVQGSGVDSVASVLFSPNGTGAPTYISVTLGQDQMQLGECSEYLTHVNSNAECTFSLSSSG